MKRELKLTRGSALGRIAARAEMIDCYGIDGQRIAKLVKRYHETVAPLRITDMALGNDINLAHDLGGILDHMMGCQRDFWTPRYAARP